MNLSNSSQIKKTIQKILNEEKPKTVKKLIERTEELSKADKTSIYLVIRELEQEKIIQLGSPRIERKLPSSITSYLLKLNYYAFEFWLILILTALFVITTMVIQEGSILFFLRITMGIIFSVFVPGWVVTSLLFPKPYEVIDQLERTLISLGINIGIMVFTGLILNQVWIISNVPYVIIISSITLLVLIISFGFRILIGKGIIDNISEKIREKYQKTISQQSWKIKKKFQKSDTNEEEP